MINKSFTTDEIWNTNVPCDFKGTKIEYLIWLRNEKKLEEEKRRRNKNKGHQHSNCQSHSAAGLVDAYLSNLSCCHSPERGGIGAGGGSPKRKKSTSPSIGRKSVVAGEMNGLRTGTFN